MGKDYGDFIQYVNSIDYSAKPDMWKNRQEKLERLTFEIFVDYVFRTIKKQDKNPSLLALHVGYLYNDLGFRHDKLRSVAEKLRDYYYKQLSTESKYSYGYSDHLKRYTIYDWKKDFEENGYDKLSSIRNSFENSSDNK
jgi:hypothetical protein